MPTLHEVTKDTKKILFVCSFLLIIFLLVGGYINLRQTIQEKFFPIPPAPPTVLFGKLANLPFPKSKFTQEFSFTIDTLSGVLPVFPDRVKVYKTTTKEPNLLALTKAEEKVSSIGFKSPGTSLNEFLYQWNDAQNPNRKLLLNINSYNFTLTSDFIHDPTISQSIQTPTERYATEKAQLFFSSLYFPSDIDSQKTKISLFAVDSQKLVPVTNVSQTKIVRLDFFQHDIDNLPFYYSFPPYSTMYVLVGPPDLNRQIVEAFLFHQDIDLNSSATYPIKTTQEAFSELQNNKAYIASHTGTGKKIRITNVYLGYYSGQIQQQHLMPIIVFAGDNDFLAYVSAIKNEWINP